MTTEESIAAEALRLIDRNGCESFTRGRCLDPDSGRSRGARYGADAWCDPCIARDALDRMPTGESPAVTREQAAMNAHDLARALLAGPDAPVCLMIADDGDGVYVAGVDRVSVDRLGAVIIEGDEL